MLTLRALVRGAVIERNIFVYGIAFYFIHCMTFPGDPFVFGPAFAMDKIPDAVNFIFISSYFLERLSANG